MRKDKSLLTTKVAEVGEEEKLIERQKPLPR